MNCKVSNRSKKYMIIYQYAKFKNIWKTRKKQKTNKYKAIKHTINNSSKNKWTNFLKEYRRNTCSLINHNTNASPIIISLVYLSMILKYIKKCSVIFNLEANKIQFFIQLKI